MQTESPQAIREALMNRQMQPYKTISLRRFREQVESIEDNSARQCIEFYYLTGSRLSEGSTVCYPSQFTSGASRSYGCFMSTTIQPVEVTPKQRMDLIAPIKTQALTMTCSVAKRGRHLNSKKGMKGKFSEPAEQDDNAIFKEYSKEQIENTLRAYNQLELLKKWQRGETKITADLMRVITSTHHTKEVALPILPADFEPWTADLLKHGFRNVPKEQLQNHKVDAKLIDMSFPISRVDLRLLIRKHLAAIMPPVMRDGKGSLKNILRHWRLQHLEFYYGFSPEQLTSFVGWSTITGFNRAGLSGGSSNLDAYVSRPFMTYYPMLLRDIKDLMKA